MVQNVLRARANVGSVVSGNILLFNWLGFCSRYSSIRCQRASVPRTRPAGVKTSPEKPREEGASDKGSRQDAQVQVILLPGPLLHACEVILVIFLIFFLCVFFLFTGCYTWEAAFFFSLNVLSQWDFSHGKFSLSSPGNATVKLPNLQCMLGV